MVIYKPPGGEWKSTKHTAWAMIDRPSWTWELPSWPTAPMVPVRSNP
jgi:hypothetical protein